MYFYVCKFITINLKKKTLKGLNNKKVHMPQSKNSRDKVTAMSVDLIAQQEQ